MERYQYKQQDHESSPSVISVVDCLNEQKAYEKLEYKFLKVIREPY